MVSSGKIRCLGVILLWVSISGFCDAGSVYRLENPKVRNSEGSIFENGREPSSVFPSGRKPPYTYQLGAPAPAFALQTANLISLPEPVSNAFAALYPEPTSSTEVPSTTETSTEYSSTSTESTSTADSSSTTDSTPNPSSTEVSSTVETNSSEATPATDSTSTASSTEPSASNLPSKPVANLPNKFPSLIELIALQPDVALFTSRTSAPTDTSSTTEASSASTESSTSDSTTETASSSTESSSSAMTDSTTEAASSSTESSSTAVSDPTTEAASSSTDSSSAAVTDPTTEAASSSTESTTEAASSTAESSSSAVSDPTTEAASSTAESSSSAVSDPTTESTSSSTDSSSPAVSDPTTEAATSSTESSSPAVSDPTTEAASSSTDSSTVAVSDPTTEAASSSTVPAMSDTPTTPPASAAIVTPLPPNKIQSIFNRTSGGLSAIASLPNFNGFIPPTTVPTFGDTPVANDSPFSQIQNAASQLISGNIPNVFNATTSGFNALTSQLPFMGNASVANNNPINQLQTTASQVIASNSFLNSTTAQLNNFVSTAGIQVPQGPFASDSPFNQAQTVASQLIAGSNIPSIVNGTTSGLNAITSLPNVTGINIPAIPTLGDTPVANDSPFSQIQSAASQLLSSSNIPNVINATTSGLTNNNPINQLQGTASQVLSGSNLPNIFNSTTSGLNSFASLPNITGINIPAIPTLGDEPTQTTAAPLRPTIVDLSSIFNKTASGLNGLSYGYAGYFPLFGNTPVSNDSPISQVQSIASEVVQNVSSNNNPITQAQNVASQLIASSNVQSLFNTTAQGLNGFVSPNFNFPQIPTFGDTPVGNDSPFTADLSNFQSQLAVLVSQLNNATSSFPNIPQVQSDSILTKPQTNPVNSAQLQPNQPVPVKHPLLTIFPQQNVQSDSYFGFPSFNLPNNTFGQFINQIAGLASNFTGGASNTTGTNTTDTNNSGSNPLQSIGNQITAGFSNVAEAISNGTAALGNFGAQIANQTTASSNGTNTNNTNGTSSAIPSANEIGGALSQIFSNGSSLITGPINTIFATNFSRAYNPSLTNLYNQLSSAVASNDTASQVISAISPSVIAGQLSGILSQLQASNPLTPNDAGQNPSGILSWNTINKIPVISNWIGTNSNNKPLNLAKPTLSCPVCQEICGQVNAPPKLRQQRVIGGTVVDPPNKYPWTTRFVYFNSNAGQGALINDRAVVTTATTVNGMPLFSQATALFNVYDTMSTAEQRFSKKLARVIPHPKFNPSNLFNNNIGIVILEGPVTMSEYIQPICLPISFDSYAGTEAVVAGWGADSIGGHPSPVPHEVSIPLYSPAECKLANGNLTGNNLCGGVVQPAPQGSEKSTCEGDDGAALMAPSRLNATVLTLIGITIETPGAGCGNTNQPAVFTNVQNYIEFILYNGIGCGC